MAEAPDRKASDPQTAPQPGPFAKKVIEALLGTEALAESTAALVEIPPADLLGSVHQRIRSFDPDPVSYEEDRKVPRFGSGGTPASIAVKLSDGDALDVRAILVDRGRSADLDQVIVNFPGLTGDRVLENPVPGSRVWLIALIVADVSGKEEEYRSFEQRADAWLRSTSVVGETARRFILVSPRQLGGFLGLRSPAPRRPTTVGPFEITTVVQAFAVPDQPIRSVADDKLNFRVYADAIAALIDNPQTETPLTLAINAPWGAGKSSLARLVDERLRAKPAAQANEPHVTLWFDAWLHDEADKLQTAFLAQLVRALHQRRIWWRRHSMPLPGGVLTSRERMVRRVQRLAGVALTFVLVSVALSWAWPDLFVTASRLFGASGSGATSEGLTGLVGPSLAALIAILISHGGKLFETGKKVGEFITNPATPANTGTLQRLRDELKALIDEVLPAKAKLIVFIDDLERCRPPRGIELLEFCNQIFTEARVVLVLMTDMAALEANATLKYKDLNEFYRPSDASPSDRGTESMFGRLFLQKMVQLQFNLPEQRQAAALAIGPAGPVGSESVKPEAPVGWKKLVEPVFAAWNVKTRASDYLTQALTAALERSVGWSIDPIGEMLGRWHAPRWIAAPIVALIAVPLLLLMLFVTALVAGGASFLFVVARGCFNQSFPPEIRRFDLDGFSRFNRRRFYLATAIAFVGAIVALSALLTNVAVDWLQSVGLYLALAVFFVMSWPVFLLLNFADNRIAAFEAEIMLLRSSSPGDPTTRRPDRQLTDLITREREIMQRMNESDFFKIAREEALKHLRLRPRSVKRLVNRIRLSVAILGEQGWLGGGGVPAEIVGRWAAFQELWPDLAASVVGRPALLGELEAFIDKNAPAPDAKFDRIDRRNRAGFEKIVRGALPRFDDAADVFDFLVTARPIAPHLEALVYMQPREQRAAA